MYYLPHYRNGYTAFLADLKKIQLVFFVQFYICTVL